MTRIWRATAWVLLGMMGPIACANAETLADATRSYRQNGDYTSLQVISAHLRKGMSRQQVEALLGSPDMEISEGSCVYGSDRVTYVEEAQRELPVVLIVEFRDENDHVTKRLQYWKLTWIGE